MSQTVALSPTVYCTVLVKYVVLFLLKMRFSNSFLIRIRIRLSSCLLSAATVSSPVKVKLISFFPSVLTWYSVLLLLYTFLFRSDVHRPIARLSLYLLTYQPTGGAAPRQRTGPSRRAAGGQTTNNTKLEPKQRKIKIYT